VTPNNRSERSYSVCTAASPRERVSGKKRNSEPFTGGFKPKDGRLVISDQRNLANSPTFDNVMDLSSLEDETDTDLFHQDSELKARDSNHPIRAEESGRNDLEGGDRRYPQLGQREAVIPELEEDEKEGEEEGEEGVEEDGVEEDSGGDASSWMTQYIAHNATLGNEKKGEIIFGLVRFFPGYLTNYLFTLFR
jgi:hypothetical protein